MSKTLFISNYKWGIFKFIPSLIVHAFLNARRKRENHFSNLKQSWTYAIIWRFQNGISLRYLISNPHTGLSVPFTFDTGLSRTLRSFKFRLQHISITVDWFQQRKLSDNFPFQTINDHSKQFNRKAATYFSPQAFKSLL